MTTVLGEVVGLVRKFSIPSVVNVDSGVPVIEVELLLGDVVVALLEELDAVEFELEQEITQLGMTAHMVATPNNPPKIFKIFFAFLVIIFAVSSFLYFGE